MPRRRTSPALFELLGGRPPQQPTIAPGAQSNPQGRPGVRPADGSPPPDATPRPAPPPVPAAASVQASRPIPTTRPEPVSRPQTPLAEPKPLPEPPLVQTRPVRVIPAPESESGGRSAPADRSIEVPVPYAFTAAALAVLIGLGIWWLAYSMGQRHADGAWRRSLGLAADAPVPSRSSPDVPAADDPLSPARPVKQPNRSGHDGLIPPESASEVPPVIPDPGRIAPAAGADPREPGLNYLVVAYLDPGWARVAAEHLTAGGIPAAAVPIDPRVDRGNNAGSGTDLQKVITLMGVAGSEFSRTAQARTAHEAEVRRLGESFRKDAKGPTDFGRVFWQKYQP